MKKQFKFLFSAAAFLLAGTVALAQSTLRDQGEEVPGDNFSLEGALELFKKSASPQEFEQLLNSPDSKVNNLDLNGDGEIDYIRVTDKTEGNVHAFILSAIVSQTESQDVAVIELEKRRDGQAVLQIVGDADVYGIETIIEPTEEVRVNAGASTSRTVVNVWAWPSVQYIYGPSYSVWASPWGWSYYPGWYRPWRPVSWAYYDPFWAPYRPYYSVCFRHRVVYAPVIYRPYRATSVVVYNRHQTQINNFRTASHGYRYDRGGDYARGARTNRYEANQRTRSSYNGGDRMSYSDNNRNRRGSSDVTRGSRSDVNRTYESNRSRTSRDFTPNNGNSSRTSRDFTPNNERSSRPSRDFTPNAGPSRDFTPQQRSTPSFERGSGGGGRSGGSAPSMRSSPSPQRHSAPAQRSNPSGGSGSHGRRH